MSTKAVIAYIPALHLGYRKFFEKYHKEYQTLLILNTDITEGFSSIRKDVRALTPEMAMQAIEAWGLFENIKVLRKKDLGSLSYKHYILPDEDISHQLAHEYLTDAEVSFSPIFLRWDRKRSNAQDPVVADVTISHDEFDKAALRLGYKESEKSSDIWRRVGAVIVKNGKILSSAYNAANPSPYSASILGDPRSNYNKGVEIEKSVFMHAEAKLIAEAAKNGEILQNTDIYVTTFPCPACAKLIAFSGIRRLFFAEGYAVLDGEEVLKARGVQLVKVDMRPPKDNSISLPYPEK